MMRRMTALLLALLLTVSCVSALSEATVAVSDEKPAFSEETQKLIMGIMQEGQQVNYTGVAQIDGTLYAFSGDGVLYRYDESAKSWDALISKQESTGYVNVLFIQDDKNIYTLNRDTGVLLQAVFSGDTYDFEQKAQLPWENMQIQQQDWSYGRDISDACFLNGKLYALVQNDDWNYDLRMFDLDSGKAETISLSSDNQFQELTPYKDGLALLSWNQLSYFDPATGALEALLGVQNATGLTTDQAGHIYLRAGDEIWSDRDGAFAVVGYGETGAANYGTRGAAILGEYTYVYLQDTPCLRDTSPDNKPEFSLRVSGASGDMTEALKAFAKLYPNVPVVRDDSTWFASTQQVADHMKGATPSDLYGFSLMYVNLSTLAKKEYIAPVSLPDYEARLSKKYSEALSYNGQMYAVPMYVDASSMGVSVKALQKIGLTEADVPKTYADFLDFIDTWQSKYASEFPEMSLFEGMQYNDMKGQLITSILHGYELQCIAEGEDISFSSPDLQRLLEKLNQTDFDGFYDPSNEDTTAAGGVITYSYGEDNTPSAVFSNYVNATVENWDDRYTLMPLSLTDDGKPYIGVTMSVMTVNPATEHKEAALALLQCIVEHLDPTYQIALLPDMNEPVENTYMIKELANMQERISKLQAAYDAGDDQRKTELKDYLEELKTNLKDSERYRYRVTAEQITQFRARDEYLVPDTGSVLGNSEELTALYARLRDKSIDPANFLRELNRKVQMMLLEGD